MQLKKCISVYKPLGITPLELVEELKKKFPVYQDRKVSYAGRLDPMASGVVLLLIGDENKHREKYLSLDKEYVIKILFGIETDSYDCLGIISRAEDLAFVTREDIIDTIPVFKGVISQKFPPFSSKRYNGKPLFYWARKGLIDGKDLPSKKRTISKIEFQSYEQVKGSLVGEDIISKVSLVKGDFRQEQIKKQWEIFFKKNDQKKYSVVELKVSCSSGTYMRSLAHDFGQKLGTGAFLYSIQRTKVGHYVLGRCMKL